MKAAIERRKGPTSLVFSRQGLAAQARTDAQVANIAKGAYILVDCGQTPEVILIATGSEVGLAVDSAKALAADGVKVNVVSMPSTDTFDAQDAAYKESVLPASVTKRVAIEAAHVDYWAKICRFCW